MKIKDSFLKTRKDTEALCAPLEIEDYVVQPHPNVSPPKWHLAHTTWFYEQFILVKLAKNYKVFHPDFGFLFNSYYNNMGARTLRQNRGFMTRPTVSKIYEYRNYVTDAIVNLLNTSPIDKVVNIVRNRHQPRAATPGITGL